MTHNFKQYPLYKNNKVYRYEGQMDSLYNIISYYNNYYYERLGLKKNAQSTGSSTTIVEFQWDNLIAIAKSYKRMAIK